MSAAALAPALFDDLYAPRLIDEAAAPDEAEEEWRLSVRLTLTEIKAICAGEMPDSLVRYCREGLQTLEGTPALARCEAHERAQTEGRDA